MCSLVNCEFLIYRQRIEQDELDRVMEACDMVRILESVYVYNIQVHTLYRDIIFYRA